MPIEPIVKTCQGIIEVLDDMEKMAHDDRKALRAIERAQSWLRNITNPLTEEEKASELFKETEESYVEANEDDPYDHITGTWESGFTDEDYRREMEFIQEMKDQDEKEIAEEQIKEAELDKGAGV